MSRTLKLPDAVYKALQQVAEASGTTPVDWIAAHLPDPSTQKSPSMPAKDDWIDRDFLNTYAQEADDSVNLETVRQAMAKIPGRLVEDIRAERDEH